MEFAPTVCTSLSIEEKLDYDVFKVTGLQVYELVPEKSANQTYVEFARKNGLIQQMVHSKQDAEV